MIIIIMMIVLSTIIFEFIAIITLLTLLDECVS